MWEGSQGQRQVVPKRTRLNLSGEGRGSPSDLGLTNDIMGSGYLETPRDQTDRPT